MAEKNLKNFWTAAMEALGWNRERPDPKLKAEGNARKKKRRFEEKFFMEKIKCL